MTFAALLLLDISITLLYSAYKDVSPFIVVRSFIEGKSIDEYEQ